MKKWLFVILLAAAPLATWISVPAALAAGPDRAAEHQVAETVAQAKAWQAWTERLDGLAKANLAGR